MRHALLVLVAVRDYDRASVLVTSIVALIMQMHLRNATSLNKSYFIQYILNLPLLCLIWR